MKNVSLYVDALSIPRKQDVDAKQDKVVVSGLLKGDGNGNISSAVAGTDYLTSAPVASVNNKTGAVTLSASDVSAMSAVAVTAADNGKFLRVVDGVWSAATVPNANGVSF